jgi:hypothetical protein
VFTNYNKKIKSSLTAKAPLNHKFKFLMVLQPSQAVNGKTWLDIEHIPSQ